MRRGLAAALAAVSLVAPICLARADGRFAVEPSHLWPGPMQGDTPQTLKGGTVIDAQALSALIERDHPVLIDVANAEPRPPDRGGGLAWLPIHRSVPGAIWLPGAGTGHDAPGFAQAFAARVAAATGGDKTKPIVTFCHPQRWGSWNAAKRLTDLGYTHVYWYPGGGEGWGAQNPMKAVTEDHLWKSEGFDKSSAGDRPDAPPPR